MASFPPPANAAVYRDLLIFEERLKQNSARLKARKNKYQSTWRIPDTVFLVLLCAVIMTLVYYVLYQPSQHWLLHYLRIGLLMVCCTMLFLFFASGIYADRITAAKNFVPQANRALWTFNMYLNMRTVSRPPRWLAPLLFWRKTAASPSATPSHIPNENDTASLGPRRLFQRRTPIQPVPPTHNERGEILFSSRVHANFRDGYERYRNAFERKRKEKLEAQRRSRPSWFTYLWSTPAKPAPPASEKEAERHAKAT